MENSVTNRTAQYFHWLKWATILTAVVIGLLSASAVQAAIIIGISSSWFNIGNGTPAWYGLGFIPPSAQGATLGYFIMVYCLPVIIASGIVLLSFRFMRGKGWIAILQALMVGLLAYWLVQAILKVIFGG
jgi:hypothetical protein